MAIVLIVQVGMFLLFKLYLFQRFSEEISIDKKMVIRVKIDNKLILFTGDTLEADRYSFVWLW